MWNKKHYYWRKTENEEKWMMTKAINNSMSTICGHCVTTIQVAIFLPYIGTVYTRSEHWVQFTTDVGIIGKYCRLSKCCACTVCVPLFCACFWVCEPVISRRCRRGTKRQQISVVLSPPNGSSYAFRYSTRTRQREYNNTWSNKGGNMHAAVQNGPSSISKRK